MVVQASRGRPGEPWTIQYWDEGEIRAMTTVNDAEGTPGTSRLRATLAVLPFLALGVADVMALVLWGVDPLWGVLIAPPILFVSAVGWVAFRSGFVRTGGGR